MSSDRIDLWAPANLVFVIIGIFVPGVARFFIFKGMERLGAPVSACLTNSTPLFAIVLAVFFLGERPTVTNLLGAFPLSQGLFRSHGAAPPKHGALATYSFH